MGRHKTGLTPGTTRLPPRTKLYGIDHRRGLQYRMTGKEWHEYTKLDSFALKQSRDGNYVWGHTCEIWLDGKPLFDDNYPFATGHAPK